MSLGARTCGGIWLAMTVMASSLAQTPPPPRAAQHAWREAADYLQLSSEQWAKLRSARAEHDQQMAQLAAKSSSLQGRKDEAALQQLCRESRRLHDGFRDRLRPMFTAEQLERLAQLEKAFELMPAVQSAQAAGLMTDRLITSPAGLPQQQVSVEVSFLRAAPSVLPGCPDTRQTVQPGMIDQRHQAPASNAKNVGAAASGQRGSPGPQPSR